MHRVPDGASYTLRFPKWRLILDKGSRMRHTDRVAPWLRGRCARPFEGGVGVTEEAESTTPAGRRRRANVEGGRHHFHKVKVTPEEEGRLLAMAAAQRVTIPRLLIESAFAQDSGGTLTERRDAQGASNRDRPKPSVGHQRGDSLGPATFDSLPGAFDLLFLDIGQDNLRPLVRTETRKLPFATADVEHNVIFRYREALEQLTGLVAEPARYLAIKQASVNAWFLSIGLLLAVAGARAGTLQVMDGTVHSGAVTLDAGVMVRATTSIKVAPSNVLLARFGDEPAAEPQQHALSPRQPDERHERQRQPIPREHVQPMTGQEADEVLHGRVTDAPGGHDADHDEGDLGAPERQPGELERFLGRRGHDDRRAHDEREARGRFAPHPERHAGRDGEHRGQV